MGKKKYTVAAYQERYYNYHWNKWGDWRPCSKGYYDYWQENPKAFDGWEVRELYALEN